MAFRRSDVADTEESDHRSWVTYSGKDRPERDLLLASHLVYRDDISTPWWMIDLIQLKDEPGLPVVEKQYPKAQYEVIILYVHPKACPNPDPSLLDRGFPCAAPAFFMQQFHGVDDEGAKNLTHLIAEVIKDVDPPLWKTTVEQILRRKLAIS